MQTLPSYVNRRWLLPSGELSDVVNPADESVIARVKLGTPQDADAAIAAARNAFAGYSRATVAERVAYLQAIRDIYQRRLGEIADAIRLEMGAPRKFALESQAWSGLAHLDTYIAALQTFAFEEQRGTTRILREPIGVAGLITPWNWPMNQMMCKIAPALAAACTMVLKPSEIAPLSANLLAEIVHEAGLPAGVFNLLHGAGAGVGQALASHPDVDLVSFTGSTRAGIAVAKAAADTVKRVTQELGGKSANLILPDADFASAVSAGVRSCFSNSGQSCDAPTRMLVPADRHEEALAIAGSVADNTRVGHPELDSTELGPVVSAVQYQRVQALIAAGIDEGATLVCGGLGRPPGLERGYYVQPTVFGQVRPHMRIAREEIFGPVLAILPYGSIAEAIAMANDSVYGLAAYVAGTDLALARQVARQLRAGQVQINYPEWDLWAPFGGYKQSGNGREYADWGLRDFLEIKAVIGHGND